MTTNWQLDQAALYSLSHYFAQHHPEFRFQVLNETVRGAAPDFIELVTSDEEKFAMRRAEAKPK